MAAGSSKHDSGWLLERLRADEAILRQAAEEISRGNGHPDSVLRARRTLEGVLGARESRISGAAYAEAADVLRAGGRLRDAATLGVIAGTEGVLAAEAGRWRTRYSARRETGTDRLAFDLIGSGQVRSIDAGMAGIDGSWYSGADLVPRPGAGPVPVAVITTAVPTAEIVAGFDGPAARARWMADRSQSSGQGPLASCSAGPECRPVREERVLAWMLRQDPGAPEPWPGLRPDSFTSDLRSEILLAWRSLADRAARRDPPLVAAELDSRLLRASAEAAGAIGPEGRTADSYLWRLAATPVSRRDAETAVAWLVRQDRIAAARPAGPAAGHAGAAAPRQPGRTADPQVPPPRPSPEDPAPGPSPHM